MTITKRDPDSEFWIACRENTERYERKVTTEQELKALRACLADLVKSWSTEDRWMSATTCAFQLSATLDNDAEYLVNWVREELKT